MLQGHGGPIKAVLFSPDGNKALTASFDNSIGLWEGTSGVRFLDGHDAAVNAIAFAGATRIVSGGDDFAVLIWDLESGNVQHRLEGHRGKVISVAVFYFGKRVASASWDGTARVWDLETGQKINELTGHKGTVNQVLFLGSGGVLTGSSDGTIREWDQNGVQKRVLVRHGFGINQLILNEPDGWLAYGAVDGGTRVIDLQSTEIIADLTLERRPILAMAASPDKSLIAVGDGQGYIMIVDTSDWSISKDFKAAKHGPIWALAFDPEGRSVLAGGIEDSAYVFPVDDDADVQMSAVPRGFHKDPKTMSNGERQFLRKCSVCHTLQDADARRAGPSLKGIFGRKAGKLEGYSFSEAMARSDLVWSAETIDALFDLGPDIYVPGSKMPMQRMTSAQDRRDLIEYLRQNAQE